MSQENVEERRLLEDFVERVIGTANIRPYAPGI
jgi:hypothetical protein